MSQASALEQYMLELINAERAKAGVQPLAFDGALNSAAGGHSSWMLSTDTFSHTGSGGSTPTQRMTAAGYSFAGNWTSAENIAWMTTAAPSGLQDEVAQLHANLMNSTGHRTNLLNGAFKEIGIGFETGSFQSWSSTAFVTQNFALTASNAFLTGVAFDDRDGDQFYDVGEGLGGLSVTAVSSTGARYSGSTLSAGGYSFELPAGTYTVTFSGSGYATTKHTVTIGSQNVKLDLVDPTAVNIINGTANSDNLSGTGGTDWVYGLGSNDYLSAATGNDRVLGGAGDDFLRGNSGNDRIYGEAGRDVLSGDMGNDVLTGGSDADTFRFRPDWGADRITDFENGIDTIDLRYNGLSWSKLSVTRADVDGDGSADDVLIRANGQSIALLNERLSNIDASDFMF